MSRADVAREALRVGDAERAEAAARMGEHYAAGRLTTEEYDERTSHIWAAKTGADLRRLFVDLPALPGAAPLSGPSPQGQQWPDYRVRRSARPGRPSWWLVVLVVLGVLFAISIVGRIWWIFAIATLVWLLGPGRHRSHGRVCGSARPRGVGWPDYRR